MKIIFTLSIIGVLLAMPLTYIENLLDFLLGIAPEHASLFFIVCGLFYAGYQVARFHMRFQRLENDVKEMKPKFKELEDKFNNRFEKMEEKFDARFEKMDERFEKMDERFEKMESRFDRLENKFDNLMMYLIDGKPEHLRKIR